MDILLYRSLIFAIIEYTLAIIVIYKGKFQRIPIALTLMCLAGYQLGEGIFLTQGHQFAIQLAVASTTLLPPFGILILERVRGKIRLYPIFQTLGAFIAFLFLIRPEIFYGVGGQMCLVKLLVITGQAAIFTNIFFFYYTSGIGIAILLSAFYLITDKRPKYRKFYLAYFLAYLSFAPVSVLLVAACPDLFTSLASLMCALAIVAAFIMTWVSLKFEGLKTLGISEIISWFKR